MQNEVLNKAQAKIPEKSQRASECRELSSHKLADKSLKAVSKRSTRLKETIKHLKIILALSIILGPSFTIASLIIGLQQLMNDDRSFSENLRIRFENYIFSADLGFFVLILAYGVLLHFSKIPGFFKKCFSHRCCWIAEFLNCLCGTYASELDSSTHCSC